MPKSKTSSVLEASSVSETPSERVDGYIAQTGGWRGERLAAIRAAILAADPEIVEEFKWRGTPVWSRNGMIAVANAFKGKVKITFAYGASLADPKGLFNADDRGNTRRSIDLLEADRIDSAALTELVSAAIAHNLAHLKKNAPPARKPKAAKRSEG